MTAQAYHISFMFHYRFLAVVGGSSEPPKLHSVALCSQLVAYLRMKLKWLHSVHRLFANGCISKKRCDWPSQAAPAVSLVSEGAN